MVIQKKQPVEEEEEFPDEEEEFEEDEQELKPVKKGVEMARTNKFAPPQPKAPENRYVAVHSPAVDGILDKLTNKLVNTGDLWQELADIKSTLHRIEENLG